MKVIAILPICWYSLLFYLGFYYLELDQQLLASFFEVGWENYKGPSLSSPENQYFGLWLFSTLVSAFLLRFAPFEETALNKILFRLNVLFFLSYLFLSVLDGDSSMYETKIWWISTSLIQVMGHSMLLVENPLTTYINNTLKYLFGVQALVYGGLLALGFYYLQWDAALVAEAAKLGPEHHEMVMVPEGRATKVPEMHYHLLLILTSLCTLGITILINDSAFNRWRSRSIFLLLSLILYSVVVYLNGYSYTMEQTKVFWMGGCSLVLLFFAFLAWTTKAPVSKFDTIYEDNVLDDFSRLH